MKVLKNPVIAVLLCIVIVAAVFLYSCNNDMQKKCDAITAQFYDGVTFDGYLHPSVHTNLQALYGFGAGLYTVTKDSAGTAAQSFYEACDTLKKSLDAGASIPDLRTRYDAFRTAWEIYRSALDAAALSEREAQALTEYGGKIVSAISLIDNSGYNESVRSFTNGLSKFQSMIVSITPVDLPELF